MGRPNPWSRSSFPKSETAVPKPPEKLIPYADTAKAKKGSTVPTTTVPTTTVPTTTVPTTTVPTTTVPTTTSPTTTRPDYHSGRCWELDDDHRGRQRLFSVGQWRHVE